MSDDHIELQDLNVNVIRFSWFKDASRVALWDAGTVLPEDAAWLSEMLCISDRLILELTAWAEARDALNGSGLADAQAVSALDAQADDLVPRLRAEVDHRYTVEHLR